MAGSSYHIRSNSLPSRPHPISLEVDQHLSRLRSSQATSTSSASSICHEINGLQDVHDSADKLLQLPLIQQALGQEDQKKFVDELLNGSLRILDVSSIAKDALLQTKECVQGLQSALRRRRGDEILSEVKKCMASRKAVKKTTRKALKGIEKKCSSKNISEEHETITMLREVEAVTFAVFESLLSLLSGPKTSSKSWSLVSKLMQPKRIACEQEETCMNELAKVDAALSTLTCKSDNSICVHNQLKTLESNIQDLEEGIECLSRHLIKSRVSLLNILNKN